MLNNKQLRQIKNALPEFEDSRLLDELLKVAYIARIPAGRDVFALGDEVNAIALLMSGSIRVYKIGETGREITLYRFSTGQSCILTATAILNNEAFSAIATVEEDAEALMIPADSFRQWVSEYPIWRSFVFGLLSKRLVSMMELVDKVAFGRLDSRVANLILEQPETPIKMTHQEIADELGSSREVISRVLGGFANNGIIRLGRGEIEILDKQALQALL